MAWLGIPVASVAFPLLIILLGRWFRVPVEEVSLCAGPCLKEWDRHGVIWRIKLIPVGSYVKFCQEEFIRLPLLRKLAMHLLPHVAIVLIGGGFAVLVGGPGLWDPRTFYLGLLQGALHPLSTGPELLRGVGSDFASQPAAGFFAVIAAIGWLNLLPFPTTGMGMAIMELIEVRRPLPESVRNLVMWLGLLLIVVLLVTWGIAVVVWLTGV